MRYILILLFSSQLLFSQDQVLSEYHESEIIVKFLDRPDQDNPFSSSLFKELCTENRITSFRKFGNRREAKSYILIASQKIKILETIELLKSTDLFSYVEPNYIGYAGGQLSTIPNDTHFSTRQWGLLNDGSFPNSPATDDADIDMELAWDIEQGSPSIIIATLDSGLNSDHPEFESRIWQNSAESYDGIDNDNNGYVDDVLGWDFSEDDSVPNDNHGHGTNVTSIMGANGNNDLGFAGVNWHSKLMTCKILDDNGFGFYSWWTDAIYYAVDNGAKVLNMSVGGVNYSEAMEEAVDYAHENDVVIMACMMNTDSDQTHYPAGYDNLISVGATSANDKRTSPFPWSSTSGSNYGEHIDFCAPGNFIYGIHYSNDNNYGSYWSGTSQATPHVAAVVSLLFSQNPSLSYDEVYNILKNSSEDMVGKSSEDVSGWDEFHGHGRLNAFQALNQLVKSDSYQALKKAVAYPNPSAGKFLIHDVPKDCQKLVVHSPNGKKVLAINMSEFTGNFVELDLSQHIDGIYILTFYSTAEEIASLQLVKGH